MAQKDWNAGIIRPVPVAPAGPYQNGAAPGVWTLDQVAYWSKQGLWPVAGNSATWFDASSLGDYSGSVATGPSGNIAFSYRTTGDGFALVNNAGTVSAGSYLPYAQDGGDVAFDSSGNIYNCTYSNTTQTQIYLAKYNSSGTNTWAKLLTVSGFHWTNPRIAVDSSGNIYLCGGQTNTANSIYSIFVVKLDSTGALIWAYYYTPPASRGVYGCGKPAINSSGEVILSGCTNTSTVGFFKVDSSGTMNANWEFSGIGGSGYVGAVVIDSSGNYYTSAAKSSPNQPALLKVDSSFNLLWAYYINDPSGNFVRTSGDGLALDTTDNGVYLGNFYIYNAPSRAAVAKFTSAGTLSWVRSLGISTSTTRPAAINSVSAYGNLWYYNYWPTTFAGPVVLFQSLNTGAGTGSSGNYSYNSVTTSATAITPTRGVLSMSRTSFTPTISSSTATSAIPTMTKTSL